MKVQIWKKTTFRISYYLQEVKVEKILKRITIGIFSKHDSVQGFC